jgi:hypothetical protein
MLKQYLPTIIPLVIIFAVMLYRLRNPGKGRPFKPNRLWIRPTILAVFGGLAFLNPAPFTTTNLLICIASGAFGVWTGYLLARHQHLTVDPVSGVITSRVSPVGMMLFAALFFTRFMIRLAVLGPDSMPPPTGVIPPQMLLYTDAALLFALGLVAAQAWETWSRAKVLLAETAAKKTAEAAQ